MVEIISVVLIGYLLGNVQTSYLLGKLIYKVDIRSLGKGNAGASNALESLGFKFGVVVGMVDILKGTLAVMVARYWAPGEISLQYIAGLLAVLGHVFPFYMNFKGGKGTATLIGMMLGINLWMGVGGMLAIVIFTIVSDYIAIGTLALVLYFIVLSQWLGHGGVALGVTVFTCVLSIYKHSQNFIRIKNLEESRVSQVLLKKNRS